MMMRQDGCEIVFDDKDGNEQVRVADVRMLLVMVRRAVAELDRRDGDQVAAWCPECGSGNVTARPADETFMRQRGCLDCNRWIDPVRLVKP